MSKKDLNYLDVEISPIMRAAAVSNVSEMQWAIDVITLSNARRWGNQELFEAKRDMCIEKVRELPLTLQIIKNQEELLRKCMDPTFWDGTTEQSLDEVIDKSHRRVKSIERKILILNIIMTVIACGFLIL